MLDTFPPKWIRSGKDPYINKANTSTLEAMRFIGCSFVVQR